MSDVMNLGNRMKRHEITTQNLLNRFIPVIIRLDGRAFHTFTRGLNKPFDQNLIETMWETGRFLCEEVHGCKLAYIQSDEISLLLTDYTTIKTQAWFDYNVQKMVSIASSIATVGFNQEWCERIYRKGDWKVNWAMFDARVFNLPKEEVCNYFIWRQKDMVRNSIQGLAQANFSHKQLHNKNCDQLQELLFQEKNINWNDCLTFQKRGVCITKEEYEINNDKNILMSFCRSLKDKKLISIQQQMSFVGMIKNDNIDDVINYFNKNNLFQEYVLFCKKENQKQYRTRWVVDKEIPIFTQDRNYIEKYL